jgi:hypothetical protein
MSTSPLSRVTVAASVLVAALLAVCATAQDSAADKPVVPAPNKNEVGVSARDGITVSGGEALITRNGQTEKLTREFVLPNGLRAQADGRILAKDGNAITLRQDQILTFEGKIIAAPLPEAIPPLKPVMPPPATPPGTAVPYFTPAPVTPRPHIKAGEGGGAR